MAVWNRPGDGGNMPATARSSSIVLSHRPPVSTTPAPPSRRAPALALFGPLLLFVHGILGWLDGPDSGPGTGWFAVLAGLTLVAGVVALALLAARLGEQSGGGVLATIAVVASAFGAGAVGAITMGRMLGYLGEGLPTALTAGGPILITIGLGLLLFRLVLVGRVPTSAVALALLGAALVAMPWGLLPLGALLLLVGLAPVART